MRPLSTWGGGGHWGLHAFPFYVSYEMHFIRVLRRILRIVREYLRAGAQQGQLANIFFLFSRCPVLLPPEITPRQHHPGKDSPRLCFHREAWPRPHLPSYNSLKNRTGFLTVFGIYLFYIYFKHSTICTHLRFSEGKWYPHQSKTDLRKV